MERPLAHERELVNGAFVAIRAEAPADQTVLMERESGRILGFGAVAVEGLKNVMRLNMTNEAEASIRALST